MADRRVNAGRWVGRLRAMDPTDAPGVYQEGVQELMEMVDRDMQPGQIMADLMDPG